MKNLCGNCNICCKKYRIDKKFLSWRDTDKAAGEMCDKLINKRCVRYLNRPKPCKNFECMWLMLAKKKLSKPQWSPDKIGFVVKIGVAEGKDAHMIEELEQGSLDFANVTPEQDTFLKMILDLSHKANVLCLIRPFGHEKQYPLRFSIK